jgi:hypothetical protein
MFTDELFEPGNISYDIQDSKIFMIFKTDGREFIKTLDSFKEPLRSSLLNTYVKEEHRKYGRKVLIH